MSRKTIYIVIAVVLLLLGGFAWYFFSRGTTTPQPADTATNNSDLFPFGSNPSSNTNQGGTVLPGGSDSTTIDLSNTSTKAHLRKVSDDQVSGAVIVSKGAAATIRYMDRATGHIFQTPADTITKTKISNVTIPRIHETLWSSDGSELVARYLKDDGVTIQSFYGRLPTTTAASAIEGYFLPANIKEMSVAGNKIVYLDPGQDGVLMSADISGIKKSIVANLYSQDWLLGLVNAKTVLVGAKPSGLIPGDLYSLDVSNGSRVKVMKDILGLTGTMSPDGSTVFASAAEGKGIATAAYSISEKRFVPISLATLSDKCAWSTGEKGIVYCGVPTAVPSGVYPDDWYQGMVSFSDRLWRIDTSDGETDLVLDPATEAGIDMDMTNLETDASSTYLMFTNKKDSSLWVFDLK